MPKIFVRFHWLIPFTLLILVGCLKAPHPTALPPPSQTLLISPATVRLSTTPSISPPTLFPTPQPSSTVHPTSPPIEAACTESHGQIESKQVPGSPPGTGFIQIYLPPCYTPSPSKRYPTLYLLHGTNTDNTQWVQLGVPETADRLILSGQAPAFIVILPREEYYQQDPNQSAYGNWVIHILLPWIDQTYPTCADRICRAIGGLSRGGSWAFRIGLADGQNFSAIGLDSAVPFSGDLANSAAILTRIPTDLQPRFYIDIGKQDSSVNPAFSVVEELTKLRVTTTWQLSDGTHNRAYWRLHVEDYLRWYTSAWK